jgi:hypothetical protein
MTDDADVSESRLHDANPGIWMMAVDAMAGYRP